jgi:hypothetical protein
MSDNRFSTSFTPERLAGTLSGIGLGILLDRLLINLLPIASDIVPPLAILIVVAGSVWSRSIQKKKVENLP